MLGRIHTYEQFLESLRIAEEAGFDNINIDLMSALPGQTIESFKSVLNTAISLEMQHISVYSLIVEDGTALSENIDKYPQIPSDEEDRDMYHMTKEVLAAAGYEQYEISNYAKKGYECRHNIKYWERCNYIGFGIGAASLYDNIRYTNISDINRYMDILLNNENNKDYCCYEKNTRQSDDVWLLRMDVEELSKEDEMSEIIKAILFGIVEGITEWLPVSSTGHMIILDELIKLNVSKEFLEVFLVVIQLGAILAVVMLYWNQLFPFSFKKGEDTIRKDVFSMWFKVIAACIPAAVVGILFDDQINELFYNYQTVATALIVFGILFIVIENKNQTKKARITSIAQITYRDAMLVGLFQLIAAIFPGTSRSGATILGGILIGLSRTTAAEFTFFLAVPVMAGASLLKILKFGLAFSGAEMMILLVGMAVSFVVSVLVIKFLMNYIRKHDFKIFGWYRIVLGILVILFFTFR